MRSWRRPLNLLKLGGLFLLVAFAFVGVDYGETFETIADSSWSLVLLSFVTLNAALLMRAFRWQFLAVRCGLLYERTYDYYAVFYSAWLAQFILPQGVSSAARLAMVSEGGSRSLGRGLAAVLIERVADVVSAALLGLVMVAYVIRNGQGLLFGIIAAATCGGVLLLVVGLLFVRRLSQRHGDTLAQRWPLVGRALGVLDETFVAFRQIGRGPVIAMILFSVAIGLVLAVALYIAALALDIHVPFTLMVAAWAVVNLALSLPISVLGLGPREGILIVALSGSGEAREAGVALGLLWFALLALSRLPGIVGWFHKPVAVATPSNPPQVAPAGTP